MLHGHIYKFDNCAQIFAYIYFLTKYLNMFALSTHIFYLHISAQISFVNKYLHIVAYFYICIFRQEWVPGGG